MLKVPKYGVFSGSYFPAFGLTISHYSVRMRENTDQKNFIFGHFSRSENDQINQFIHFDKKKFNDENIFAK